MRGARTLAIALSAGALVPAIGDASVKQRSVYSMLKASGNETMTFTAEPSTCARFGTCGNSGTVTYRFGGAPRGKLVLEVDNHGRVNGMGSFVTSATTVAHTSGAAACTDTVRHHRDTFTLGARPKAAKLTFGLHGDKTDYLATKCAGPTENDIAADRALPYGTFKRTDFDGTTTAFGLTGSSVFREQGYRGTVKWKLTYRVMRQSCSPHCRAVSTGP